MQTTASDLAALDAALARDVWAQARAEALIERRALRPSENPAQRYARAACVGEALL